MGWMPLSQNSPSTSSGTATRAKANPACFQNCFFRYFVVFHWFVIYFKFFINPCRSIFYGDISTYNTNHITQQYYNYYLNKPNIFEIILKIIYK